MQASPQEEQTHFQKTAEIRARQLGLARVMNLPGQAPTVARKSTNPRTFADTDEGSGAFGHWTVDEHGLPAYVYNYPHRQGDKVLAYYINSRGLDRRDHWHQIGNDRVTGLASNDGVVQLYLGDRGGIFLNYFAPANGDRPQTIIGYVNFVFRYIVRIIGLVRGWLIHLRSRGKIMPRGADNREFIDAEKLKEQGSLDAKAEFAFSGGYSYLDDGESTWATAYRFGPEGAETSRVFGVGYFGSEMTHKDIRHARRVYAPYGNDPVLITEVEIHNRRSTPVNLRCYEYWDANVNQMRVQWIRTGLPGAVNDSFRVGINSHYEPNVEPSEDEQMLRFWQRRLDAVADEEKVADEEVSGFLDRTPPGIFLANLSESPANDYYVDKVAFFGNGTARLPQTVKERRPGKTDNPKKGDSMPYCLVLRHDVHLEPGQSVRLRYAYGAITHQNPQLATLDFLPKYYVRQTRETFAPMIETWKKRITCFWTGQDDVLHREMAWHSYNMLSATLYSEFYKIHYTPQGSAYLYLHGADGAPRDQALFTVPMIYVRPDLARDMLCLLMGLRNADTRAIPYSFVGNGAHDNALGLHAAPSDLDLFFLLAVAEYLSATGHMDFLDETCPLYKKLKPPKREPDKTVLEHIRIATDHLIDEIGFGKDGLLAIGTGDWDDAIVAGQLFGRLIKPDKALIDRDRTGRDGGSVPNSQMALYLFPLIANLVESRDPALAAKLREKETALKKAVKKQWDKAKGWFYRAYLVTVNGEFEKIGDGHVSLQSQIWPLISGLAAEMGIEAQLVETIQKKLDDPSPTGAMLEEVGMVWPAVSQLLTWGYQRNYPGLAWRSLNRQTFAAHATVFPNIWFNIWTGPDGTNGEPMPSYPGGTWASEVTPMTDFPALNANQDAMSLFGLLRVCGIEPARDGSGLDIAPKAPPERFILEMELLYLDVQPGRIAGEYCAFKKGALTLHVYAPGTPAQITATLNGGTVQPAASNRVDFPLRFEAGDKFQFEVTYQ